MNRKMFFVGMVLGLLILAIQSCWASELKLIIKTTYFNGSCQGGGQPLLYVKENGNLKYLKEIGITSYNCVFSAGQYIVIIGIDEIDWKTCQVAGDIYSYSNGVVKLCGSVKDPTIRKKPIIAVSNPLYLNKEFARSVGRQLLSSWKAKKNITYLPSNFVASYNEEAAIAVIERYNNYKFWDHVSEIVKVDVKSNFYYVTVRFRRSKTLGTYIISNDYHIVTNVVMDKY